MGICHTLGGIYTTHNHAGEITSPRAQLGSTGHASFMNIFSTTSSGYPEASDSSGLVMQ